MSGLICCRPWWGGKKHINDTNVKIRRDILVYLHGIQTMDSTTFLFHLVNADIPSRPRDLSAFVSWNLVSPPHWAVWEFLAGRNVCSDLQQICFSVFRIWSCCWRVLVPHEDRTGQEAGLVWPQTALGRGAKRALNDVETLHFSIFARGIHTHCSFLGNGAFWSSFIHLPSEETYRSAGCSHLSVKETKKMASSREAMTLRVIDSELSSIHPKTKKKQKHVGAGCYRLLLRGKAKS